MNVCTVSCCVLCVCPVYIIMKVDDKAAPMCVNHSLVKVNGTLMFLMGSPDTGGGVGGRGKGAFKKWGGGPNREG